MIIVINQADTSVYERRQQFVPLYNVPETGQPDQEMKSAEMPLNIRKSLMLVLVRRTVKDLLQYAIVSSFCTRRGVTKCYGKKPSCPTKV